tara:strand:- start:1007 stop:1765 length:759 start_codon:yes stop_codon:yes gene_type:complete
MKIKSYTNLDFNDLNNNSSSEQIFNSDERSKLSELEFKKKSIHSRKELIKISLKKNFKKKFKPFQFLIDRISEKNYNNILSLGSGSGDIEYFLSLTLNKDQKLYAAEFDKYLVRKATEFFPEFTTFEFDFFKDSFQNINQKFDLVYSFGSFYVMDNDQFIKLLKNIKASGVKEIIDFHAGYMTRKEKIKHIFKTLISIFQRPNSKPIDSLSQKFHGYIRDRSELIKIYKKAGWEPIEEIRNYGIYKFICILN